MTKGYKGMRYDMTCRGFKYEIGKTYYAKGDVKLCKNGFHFCKNLRNVFRFYKIGERNRFFEVEGNIIESDNEKSVADKLHIVRELTKQEINRCYYGGYYDDYYRYHGYGSDDCGNGSGNGYGDNGYDSHSNGYYGNDIGNGYGYGFGNIEKTLKFV